MTILNNPNDRDVVVRRLMEKRATARGVGRGDMAAAARICGVSESQLYRWLKRGSATASQYERYELNDADLFAYFSCRGDVTNAFRMLEREGKAPPSLTTFRRAINRELDSGTRAAAKHGAAARAQHRVALRSKKFARNERWEGDHVTLDIEVMVPRSNKPKRPYLTWLIDCGTRHILGWAISIRPTRGEVLAAIRASVQRDPLRGPAHGVPLVMVWDNGLEFTADAVSEAAVMIGSYAAPTFPYSPEKKPKIERVNGTIQRELLATLPYYTKGPVGKDGQLYGPAERLPLEILVDEVGRWIDHYNLERPHSALGGQTPAEAWATDPTPIRTIPDEDLRRFTLERRSVKVVHDGGVTLDRRKFTAPELHGLVKETVELGAMPHDYSRVEIYLNDKWLCTATPTDSLTPAQVEAHHAMRKRLDAKSARERRRVSRSRPRLAPMTADERAARELPIDPSAGKPEDDVAQSKDILGFGDEIGSVE